ncbi:MAG: sigma-54-dependent Fis family transcriptional regulator [Candidatus Latescibacteria bacterium]|nr:sigma-54-dependent Fis family transcriptional regulator [Candidatus Latescibacterota bacterium]
MDKTIYPSLPVMMVDDELFALKVSERILRTRGYNNLIVCNDSREVLKYFSRREIGVLMLDLSMPHITGQELLIKVTDQYPEVPVIIITGTNEVETAVNCMRTGAFDYMVKPVEESRMISGIQRAVELRELRQDYSTLKEHMLSKKLHNPDAFSDIITIDTQMLSIFKYIESIAKSNKPVLITGETGVGKELIAHSVHLSSKRNGNFITVNVAGLDDTIFSDTLFGHLKGAFTGALETRSGLIEKASGGTLFLDEIGDLSMSSQIKLLRLLQEHEYLPLGSDMAKLTDARIVMATNRELNSLKDTGDFRKDLYYRLITHHISVPPLRERKEDIPVLVDYFLEIASKSLNKKKPTPPKELYTLLHTFHFPGNIRELEAIVFDAVSVHDSRKLSLDIFKSHISQEMHVDQTETEYESHIENDMVLFSEKLPTIKQTVNLLIKEAVERANGNQSIAARLLGISRTALNKRLRGIDKDDD